jgi:hypothetical protein
MPELTALPAEVLQNHVAFLATSDAGKTYAAKTAIEDLLDAGARACVIDPKGVWYGMRLQPDGKKASRYQMVIFGGDHADVPLDGVSGTRLAQVIAEGDFSAIIDTRRITVGERTRLFADFAEGLTQFNSRALHLVIDEAHLFAPQGRVQDFDSGRMVHAANELVSGGRSLGLRVMVLSQRPAKLHKDSLSQVQTLVAMMNMGPHDRKAVSDWIKDQADPVEGKAIMTSLPSLQVGHGWVWSPRRGILEPIHFRRLRTFDSSATPADGAPLRPTVPLSSSNLAQLRRALAPPPAADVSPPSGGSSVKPAPAARKEVAVTVQDSGAIAAARAEGVEEGRRVGHEAGKAEGYRLGVAQAQRDAWPELERRVGEAIRNRLGGAGYLIEQDLHDSANPDAVARQADEPPAAAPAAKAPLAVGPPKPQRAAPGEPGSLALRLLDAALQSPRRELTFQEVAVLAGVSGQSGPFHKAKAELLAAGTIVPGERPGYVAARDWNGEVNGDLRASEVIDQWAAKLGGMAGRFIRHLYVVGPRTKHQVAAELEVSHQSGPFHGGWKQLRVNNLTAPAEGDALQVASIIRALKAVAP